MAKQQPPAPAVAASSGGPGVHLDEDRQLVCLEAVWEIDALARTLPGMFPNPDNVEDYADECMRMGYLLRAAAGRMLRLTSVLMSCIGDDIGSTAELMDVVLLTKGQG